MSDDNKIVRFKPRQPKLEPLLTDAQRCEREGGFDGKVIRGEAALPAHMTESPPLDLDGTAGE